jgi:hypothetical protein
MMMMMMMMMTIMMIVVVVIIIIYLEISIEKIIQKEERQLHFAQVLLKRAQLIVKL